MKTETFMFGYKDKRVRKRRTEATQFHHGAEIMHMASNALLAIYRLLVVALNHTTT